MKVKLSSFEVLWKKDSGDIIVRFNHVNKSIC